MNKAIRIIYDEHRSISAVLSGLKELALAARNPGVQPEFPVFHAMIHFIDEFPERLHHPKEDQYLFRLLRQRSPEAEVHIARLEADHRNGPEHLDALLRQARALAAGETLNEAAFFAALHSFVEHMQEHIRLPPAPGGIERFQIGREVRMCDLDPFGSSGCATGVDDHCSVAGSG